MDQTSTSCAASSWHASPRAGAESRLPPQGARDVAFWRSAVERERKRLAALDERRIPAGR